MRPPTWIVVLATAVACSSGDQPTKPRFVSLGADVVRDADMGLVWVSRDIGQGLSWLDADKYCRGRVPASSGARWRLPSIEELVSLYDTSMEQPCGEAAVCRINPAIDLSSPYQWSATAPAPDRRVYFDFSLGSRLAPLIRPSLTRGTLCTRGEQDEGP